MPSALSHLECSACGERYDADVPQQLCRDGKPLLARYDLAAAARTLSAEGLRTREPSLWRYAELLPLRDQRHRVSLGEAMTPLLPLPRLSARYDLDLFVKDEGLLPTASFKARGAAVGVSRAKELGIAEFALPTNGNAGGAWAAYAARGGLRAHVALPQSAPAVNRLETVMVGADVRLVDGLIGDAGAIVGRAVARRGWFDASTLKEPYRIEGKKTLGFELAEQLGWRVPDAIVYPTGGGVGLIGIDKALRELRALGLIGAALPRMVAVQSTGCAPVVKAFDAGADHAEPWPDPKTVAFGITVPKLLGDALVLRALYDTNGTALAVDDETLLARQRELASAEGVFVCPEGGATLAAAIVLRERGWIRSGERVLLINTGSGLKYPDVPYGELPLLAKSDDL
ncbi:MAG: threonine synthase [Candidatus Eremiobacteraeota bacterium]|jgi:threonine synthase|nr:threonine synthase [Candidatus Eremiobacteraeota bacterium]